MLAEATTARYTHRPLRGRAVTDLGELMTTDSYRAAVRPLLLTAAWFAFLACAAFAWAAAVEAPRPTGGKPVVLVLQR